MKTYYVAVTEKNKVFGGADLHGCSVAWAFDDKEIAKEFLKDFRNYWPYKKVVNFVDPTMEELDAFLEDEGLYPIINPSIKIFFTNDNLFFPCIVEGKDSGRGEEE